MEIRAVTNIYSETAVATEIDGFTVITEPPISNGGSGQFPPATRLMIASLLNCSFSGLKVFCEKREISTDGMKMEFLGDMDEGIYKQMQLCITLPKGFPEKYIPTVDKVLESCSVKKIAKNLPEIAVELIMP